MWLAHSVNFLTVSETIQKYSPKALNALSRFHLMQLLDKIKFKLLKVSCFENCDSKSTFGKGLKNWENSETEQNL